ncbi:USH2A [Mytilus edulis]|uniref:USH2A n=1 Tax=Mytilus edulis TaxID=6550 RepID=A0A8S3UAN0_MYTED|nr:USH2A [Mytilus edulis]
MQLFIVISCWLILIGCFVFGEEISLREKWKSQIKVGLADGMHLVDIFSTEPRSKVFNQINLLTNFIGTVDSLAAFIQEYNPKTEQKAFKELKKKFTDINRKLELTTDKGFGRDLREIYFELRNIEFSFLIFNRFLEKLEELKCTSQDECETGLQWTIKLFNNDFDIVDNYRQIVMATLNGTRFSKMSLLQQVKETSGCNQNTILKFGTNLLLKLFKAEQIMVVYGKLSKTNTNSISQISSWTQEMYAFRSSLQRVVQECSSKKVCKAKCKNAKCVHLSMENRDMCCCPQYYDGTKCQMHNQVILAMDTVAVMSTLNQVPKAGDIIDLKLATNLLIASMKCISFAYETIQKVNTEAIQTHVLTTSDLGSFYNTYLSMNYLITSARKIIKCDKIETHEYKKSKLLRIAFHLQKALYKIDSYLNYRRDEDTFQPESLHARVIKRNKNEACTSDFKTKIDNLWRQFHIAQANGFSVLLQVRHVLHKDSPKVLSLFEQRVKKQIQFLTDSTCSAEIAHSTNVHCDKFHLMKDMDIENRCMKGYIRKGTRYIRCKHITSDCLPCNCNTTGSLSPICNSKTGQCNCREHFLGKNCNIEIKQDCKWSDWASWSVCSKACGIGSKQKRSRHIILPQKGSGKKCQGEKVENKQCFNRCCDGTFECKNSSICSMGIKCQPCNCDHEGSLSGRCQHINGACSCKASKSKIYGRRCQELLPKDCSGLDKKIHKSGVYKISPDSGSGFKVYCDMDTDGGHWTVNVYSLSILHYNIFSYSQTFHK